MTEVRRYYFVSESGRVQRIPQPLYHRLLLGTSKQFAFAGKAIRFAEMTLWLDEDRIITNALTWFPLLHFDLAGRRDAAKQRDEMELVMREVSAPDGDWCELYRAERFAAFRWTPSQEILMQLLNQLPHTPSQWAAKKHISL